MLESTALRKLYIAIAGIATLAWLVLGSHTNASAQDNAQRSTALYRVTLIVSDIDQSMDFYRRLGLISRSDVARSNNDAGGIISGDSFPLTDDPTRSRLVIMANDVSMSGAVALLWYDRPPLPSARGNLMGLGTGDVVMMFQVPDIQGVYSRLNSVNTRFHEPPTRFTSRGPDGERQTGQRLMAYDPDGHMVEITQID